MAQSTYTPVSVNFSGSNTAMGNALGGFKTAGTLADSMLDNIRKDADSAERTRQFNESNKLAIEAGQRQQAQLDLQNKQYQDTLTARKQGNDYVNAMQNATSTANLNAGDQNALGSQIAALGDKAAAARQSGDVNAANSLEAQQKSLTDSYMTKMQNAAKGWNSQQKIDSVNQVRVGDMVDPSTVAALHGMVVAPLQQDVNAVRDNGFRMQQIRTEAGLRQAGELAIIAAKTGALQDRALLMDPKTGEYVYGSQYKNMSDADKKRFVPETVIQNTLKAAQLQQDAVKSMTWVARDPNTGVIRPVEPGTPGAWQLSNQALHGAGGLGSSGGGGGANALKDEQAMAKVLDQYSQSILSKGGPSAREGAVGAATDAQKDMTELGIPKALQTHMVTEALDAARKSSVLWGGADNFNEDMFKRVLAANMNTYANGGFVGQGLGSSPNRDKLAAYLAKQAPSGTSTNESPLFSGVKTAGTADNTAAKVAATLPAKGIEMGKTMEQLQDDRVKQWMSAPNKGMAREQLMALRNSMGPTAFEERYPGVALSLGMYR